MPFELQTRYKLLLVAIATLIVAAYYLIVPPIPGAPCVRYVFTGEGHSIYRYTVIDTYTRAVGSISHDWTSETVDGVEYEVNDLVGNISFVSGLDASTMVVHRKIYLSKSDRSCVFKVEDAGPVSDVFTSIKNCSMNEIYPGFSYFRRCASDLKKVGVEHVQLSVGEFDAVIYEEISTGSLFWDAGLPFPVKIQDQTLTYFLSEYQVLN